MPIATPVTPEAAQVAVADLNVYLQDPKSEAGLAECRKVAESLILTGALIVKDSRADASCNDRFLDLLENYFAQDKATLEKDLRPELGYQVVRDSQADPKSRFFWRMTEEREKTGIKAMDMHEAPNVVPEAFAGVWQERMEDWGGRMKQAVQGVAEMLSVGLGLPSSTIYDASRYGSHLLAPTATDLNKYGHLNSIFAGFHSDLNFLTIHGKSRVSADTPMLRQLLINDASRYPGLHIWARNTGKKMPVKVPDGCLLVQAGKQLEWFSGGLVKGDCIKLTL
ncbi:hypothetical protein QFC19_001611 [Naganishia cerealis]|uniref:Uncharacterized protein n=1 Tax=Naganishia cerealis TaxID=610337 RepID=A0ACC2WFF7_9TREE|nr:hypothetical protein QFC19_001611 [Naganishia cerealis]